MIVLLTNPLSSFHETELKFSYKNGGQTNAIAVGKLVTLS
jgi:hypothetical protein